MRRLQGDMDRMLLELTGTGRMYGCATCGFRPNVDVYYSKSANAMTVKLELAGVEPADVELETHDRMLMVRGTRRDKGQKDKVYQQMEIGYGTFERRLRMPLEVSTADATAAYRDGFLEITLPVIESETRKIPIRHTGSEAGEGAVEPEPGEKSE